jgi:hypothetical protein
MVLLIARREFMTRVRSRFFLIGTAVLVVLLAAFIVLQGEVLNRTTTTVKVGFVGASQVLAQPLAAASAGSVTVKTQLVQSVSSGEDQVRSGSLDALVSGDPAAPEVEVKDQLDSTVTATLNRLVQDVVFKQALAGSRVDHAAIDAKVAAAGIHLAPRSQRAPMRMSGRLQSPGTTWSSSTQCRKARSRTCFASWRRRSSARWYAATGISTRPRMQRRRRCWRRPPNGRGMASPPTLAPG